MNKDTLVNLRVSKELKEAFQYVVEREGFTMSEVLEASMRDVVKRDIVPINLRTKVDKKRRTTISVPFIKACLDEILEKTNNPKIKSVSLFGSYAKGTAKASSDVDLFLDVDEGFDLFDFAELQIELERALGKRVDIATRTDDEYFMSHIQRERIQLYERRA